MADRAELRGPASWPAVIAALTWLVTFAMLQWSVVRFEIAIVLTLTGAAAVLGWWQSRYAARARDGRVVPRWLAPVVLLASAAITWQVPLFSYLRGGALDAARWAVTITAIAVASLLWFGERSRLANVAAYASAVAGQLALAVICIVGDPAPRIDVWVMLQQASDVLADGGNIYTATWSGSPGVKDAFTYLPWMAVLLAPGRWVAGDIRWMMLIWSLMVLWGVWLLARGHAHRAALAAGVLVVAPGTITQIDQAWTEPVLAALLVGWAVLVQRGRMGWAIVVLALACASKQHLVLLLPLMALWRPFGWQRVLASAAVAGALIAPFALRDLPAFVHDTVTLLVGFHPIRFANTWFLYALNVHGMTPPFWATGAVTVAILAIASVAIARRQPGLPEVLRWAALVLLVANLVNKQAFYNQFWLSAALLVAALAASSGDGVGGSRTDTVQR